MVKPHPILVQTPTTETLPSWTEVPRKAVPTLWAAAKTRWPALAPTPLVRATPRAQGPTRARTPPRPTATEAKPPLPLTAFPTEAARMPTLQEPRTTTPTIATKLGVTGQAVARRRESPTRRLSGAGSPGEVRPRRRKRPTPSQTGPGILGKIRGSRPEVGTRGAAGTSGSPTAPKKALPRRKMRTRVHRATRRRTRMSPRTVATQTTAGATGTTRACTRMVWIQLRSGSYPCGS
mmetsp:Transcript_121885/g.344747  ORF Transcript_121885/g.344747 Transcript_121885/m.344747 type:complete len:235 (+) Transcript_121885:1426-2130(+)